MGEFMEVILDMRGSKAARVKDVVNLRKHINYKFQRLESQLTDMDCLARYHRARSCLQDEALSDETPARGAQGSFWGNDVRANRTQRLGQSHRSGVTTVAMLQDIVTGSLCDLRASHERELAALEAENLRLVDKLADLGKAAGKSLADVLEVAAKAKAKAQWPTDSTNFGFSSSISTAATATAGPQPATSPCKQVQMLSEDLSRISSSAMEKFSSAHVTNPFLQLHPIPLHKRGQMSE